MRDRREARQTPTQARANLMQTMQAVLWLISLACLGMFASKSSDDRLRVLRLAQRLAAQRLGLRPGRRRSAS
jgi:hypothetical protein